MIQQKLKDLVAGQTPQTQLDKSRLSFFLSNVLIALSGFILYSDKVLTFINVQFNIPAKFQAAGMDFQTFVWMLSQTISPLLIIIGAALKPKTLMYAVPIYCYMLQLYWIFLDYKVLPDDSYLQFYVVGTTILVMIAIVLLRYLLRKRVENKIALMKNRLKNEEN